MSHQKYFEHEILSAPPQKLQLLLIDAALRHGQRAKKCWGDNNDMAARRAIEQMQAIVMQLLNGLAADNSHPLVRRVAAVYAFVLGELAKSHLQRDEEALDGVVRVLQIERETWWQVCQQLAASSNSAAAAPHFAKTPEAATASTFSLDA
jgi:flagellar protein FliS